MEIKVKNIATDSYTWTVTDDLGAVLEYGTENSKEAAYKAAEMATAWIQSQTKDY
jgi:hypothetical protein